MNPLQQKKYELLKALYDSTFVLKRAVEMSDYESIESMVAERDEIIAAIDEIKAPDIDRNSDPETYDKLKEILCRIKELDDFNIANMGNILDKLTDKINEGNRKKSNINKMKSVYGKYQGVVNYQGMRMDTHK